MTGMNTIFHKAHGMNDVLSKHEQHPHASFLRRLYQQAKQVSQIIAYIWRWTDEDCENHSEQRDVANKLKVYFSSPSKNTQEVGLRLKKLFKANPKDANDQTTEANLLRAVFFQEGVDNEGYIFPIFNDLERGELEKELGYLFEISVNEFTGSIDDADINSPELLKMIIPYPPRPAFGQATLETQDLDMWIQNRDKDKYFADSHYIPTSCS